MENNRKLKVAVIGLGKQALEDHITAIEASHDVSLIGVVDPDKEKLKSFVKNHKKIDGYCAFNNLLEKNKPDFIIVAVPHYLHYEITKMALMEGIHVLKEKPFAISLSEARELKEMADQNHVQIAVTLQRRFNPIYSTFFQFIDKIGKPFYIQAKYTFYTDNPDEGWRGLKELAGGGCLIDMGYHIIDLLMWYCGLPEKVFAETSHCAKEDAQYSAEDTAQIIFRYELKDIWGSLLVSRCIPPKQEYIDVYGTRGNIHIERGLIQRFSQNGELQECLKREHSWPSAAQDQLEYFVKVIKGQKENISNPEFHFNHLSFIEAAYRSRETQKYENTNRLLNT